MSTSAEGESNQGTVEGLEADGSGVLDEGMALIRRKTIAIKSDNVSDVLMSNIGSIQESVAKFKEIEEQSSENDIGLQLQNQRENYESQMQKL